MTEEKTQESFYERVIDVQSQLKAPKNSYNSFGKYKYRSAEAILLAVKPLLKENSLLLTLNDDVVPVGDRIYVKATATLCDMKEPSLKVSVTGYAREQTKKGGMDESQVTGSCSSYARKYALSGLFLIDDEASDPDAQEPSKTEKKQVKKEPEKQQAVQTAAPQPEQPKLINQRQANDLEVEVQRTNTNLSELLKYYNVSKATELTVLAWQDAMRKLKVKELRGQMNEAAAVGTN